MGQHQSTFLYSPLEFVEYKKQYEHVNIELDLISFIEYKLNIKRTEEGDACVKKIAHKIRCISEGWDVLPKIQFEFIKYNDIIIPRVAKITDGV